jgi:hypothetical protein
VDWLKLSVDLPDHPKVAELSDRAFRALIASWCYAARFETDGYLPQSAVRMVGLTARLGAELEGANLMHQNGAGWVIHDWQDHQADAMALKRMRENAARRRKRFRDRHKEEDASDV